jgi:histidine triad (HIT) family protein
VIPRKRGDGLRGFMWPKRPYKDEAEKLETARKIKEAMKGL